MMQRVLPRFNALGGARRLLCASAPAASPSEQAKSVSIEMHQLVALIKFNNPTKRNALNDDVAESFKQAIESLKEQVRLRQVRAIVVTGNPEGNAFCAGAELEWLDGKRAKAKEPGSRNAMYEFYECFLSLRNLPVPVIAAVNGAAVGAGLGIAMGCDIRIMAKDAKLALTFMKLGLSPGMGTTSLLPTLVGLENATRLLLTSEFITGEQAKAMGLASESVDKEEVLPVALKMAHQMTQTAFEPSRFVLLSMRSIKFNGFKTALGRESLQQAMDYRSKHFEEGIRATIERRTPDFNSLPVVPRKEQKAPTTTKKAEAPAEHA